MSKRRTLPNGADMAYDAHLTNTPFRAKPQSDAQAQLERMHLRFLTELSLNRFRWIGLPPEIDPRFLEVTMLYQGYGLFYYDKRFARYMFTKASTSGMLNAYDNPSKFRSIATRYPGMNVFTYKETTGAGVGVPVWPNLTRTSDLDIVLIAASRLARTDRTIDINLDNARHNKFVLSTQRTRLSMENISREMEQGNNSIKVDAKAGNSLGDLDFIKAVDLGINPDHIEKLHIIRTRLFNDACTMLGIDNSNEDKKERLVSAEVDAGADKTLMVRYANLQARQYACTQINDAYGLNVWVEYNTEIDKMVDIPEFAKEELEEEGFEIIEPEEPMLNAEKDGDDDEQFHDAIEGGD